MFYTQKEGEATQPWSPRKALWDNADTMETTGLKIHESWKVTPSRGRAAMEFLNKDRSLSPNPENTPTYDDLKKCRYLRVGKSDESHLLTHFQ